MDIGNTGNALHFDRGSSIAGDGGFAVYFHGDAHFARVIRGDAHIGYRAYIHTTIAHGVAFLQSGHGFVEIGVIGNRRSLQLHLGDEEDKGKKGGDHSQDKRADNGITGAGFHV